MLENDVAHTMAIKDDVAAYLAMWHDDIGMDNDMKPHRKPYACGIRIPN